MSRDTEKYWYAQVGIPRTEMLTHLREEAKKRGVPVSTHITDLLVDREDFIHGNGGKGIWIPRGTQSSFLPSLPSVPSLTSGETQDINEDTLEENLDAFFGHFDDDDSPTEPQMRVAQ